jgi:hypothetical protein
MKEEIVYSDATVTVNAGLFGPTTIDVTCRKFYAHGMSPEEFAALVYPSIDARAKLLEEPEPSTGDREDPLPAQAASADTEARATGPHPSTV